VDKQSSYNRRPYESFMYLYNGIVYDYNKFAELSKTPILKNITQPDLFILQQPYQPQLTENTNIPTTKNPKPDKSSSADKSTISVATSPEKPTKITVYDTIKVVNVQKVETVKRDTVYIEKNKVDTVYIHTDETDKDFLSMRGYAANNMVLLLDVSSSMAAPQKLPLLKQSVKLLLQIMRPEDEISIVVYSGEAKVVLPPTSAKETAKIYKIIDKLHSEGATNGNEGIKLAYKVASKNFKKGGNNRIVLASDGEFAITTEVSDLISQQAIQDIRLSVFDFGNNPSSAKILQNLATKGKGEYEHITRENADISLIRQAKAKVKEVK
jgi:Mg-chelatase subunit ChlD